MENKNLPAFPRMKQVIGTGDDYHEIPGAEGLTKRELFAMAAMQGILSSTNENMGDGEWVAKDAVRYADSVLTELSKKHK